MQTLQIATKGAFLDRKEEIEGIALGGGLVVQHLRCWIDRQDDHYALYFGVHEQERRSILLFRVMRFLGGRGEERGFRLFHVRNF